MPGEKGRAWAELTQSGRAVSREPPAGPGRTGGREGPGGLRLRGGRRAAPPGQGDTHAPASRELLCGPILHFRIEAQTSQDPPGFGLCGCCAGSPQFLIHLGEEEEVTDQGHRNPEGSACEPAESSTFSSRSAAVSSPCSSCT